MTSNLGGGVNGHLGLVLSQSEYKNISDISYQQPKHPGKLSIPASAKSTEISRLTKQNEETLREFRKNIDVKQTLIKQIVTAIDTTYLKSLQNMDTNTITKNVYEVLQYLFRRYGKVTKEKLQTEEMQLKLFAYNLQDPLVILLDKVEDITKLA